LDPVRIDFLVGGMRDVDRAFESVQQRIVRLENASTSASTRGASQRVKVAQNEASSRERAATKMAAGYERGEVAATGAVATGARERTRSAEQEARRRQRIIDNSASYAGRVAAQQANQEIREAERATKGIERERAKRARGMMNSVVSGTGARLGRLGSMAGAVLGIGAGFAVADMARDRLKSERIASRLSSMATAKGRSLGGVIDGSSMQEIMAKAGQVSIATGTKKEDLLQAAASFTGSTGRFSIGQRNLDFFAKVSKVTGKDVGEVSNLAANLVRENKGISDQDLRRSMLATLSPGAFGRAGAGDVGQMVAKIESTRGAFKGPASETQKQLLTLGQLGFEATGNAKMTSAAIGGLSKKALNDKKGKLAALGVKVGAEGIEMSPMQMVEAVLKGSGGNVSTIAKALGAAPAGLFEGEHGLAATYRSAEAAKKGSGIEAVRAQVGASGAGLMTEEDLDKGFAEIMGTAAEKFDKAVNTVKEAIESRLSPFIDALADKISSWDLSKIEKFIDAVAGIAEYLMGNPFTGIGAALIISVGNDVVQAKVGQMIGAAVTANVAEAGIGLMIGGALVALIAGIDIGKMISDYALHGQSDQAKAQTAGVSAAANAENELVGGKLSAGEIQDRIAKIKKLKEQAGESNVAQDVVGAIATVVNPDASRQESKAKAVADVQMEKALQDLQKALEANTAATHKNTRGGPGGATGPGGSDASRNTDMGSRGGGTN
jgi:hypothetical protein